METTSISGSAQEECDEEGTNEAVVRVEVLEYFLRWLEQGRTDEQGQRQQREQYVGIHGEDQQEAVGTDKDLSFGFEGENKQKDIADHDDMPGESRGDGSGVGVRNKLKVDEAKSEKLGCENDGDEHGNTVLPWMYADEDGVGSGNSDAYESGNKCLEDW